MALAEAQASHSKPSPPEPQDLSSRGWLEPLAVPTLLFSASLLKPNNRESVSPGWKAHSQLQCRQAWSGLKCALLIPLTLRSHTVATALTSGKVTLCSFFSISGKTLRATIGHIARISVEEDIEWRWTSISGQMHTME